MSNGNLCEARYANYFRVGHAEFEVVLEFGQVYDDTANPQVHTRIVMSPVDAGDFAGLLRESLQQYESSFGPIREVDRHE
jgi:hypothetical protein